MLIAGSVRPAGSATDFTIIDYVTRFSTLCWLTMFTFESCSDLSALALDYAAAGYADEFA